VVYSRKDLDCQLAGRDYYLFDTGMATAFLILRATELGLVAHPIAGYDEAKVKDLLDIPKDMTVITLVNVGRHSATVGKLLTEQQAQSEKSRPARKPINEILSIR
jgi:nitroreductase